MDKNKKTNMDKNKERDMEHRKGHLAMAVAVGVLLALTGVSAASAEGWAEGCAEQFELAQRTDMESFRDYDRETWRDAHAEDAVTILTSGTVIEGRDAIVTALAAHFDNREAVWSWTELSRRVEGCKTAHILYETVYEIERIGLRIHALTGVTYTYEHGRWLSVADQGTVLPG